MAQIHLSNGGTTQVDDHDFKALSKRKWWGTGRRYRYAVTKIANRHIRLHRLLINARPGEIVDHANGDTLDNRRGNLRVATYAQNCANQKPKPGKLKGAYFDKKRNRWSARIRVEGRLVWLGRFLTAEEAARAYDTAALSAYGEFAALNYGGMS